MAETDRSWEIDLSYGSIQQSMHVNLYRETITLRMPDDWPFLDRRQAISLAEILTEAAANM